MWKHAKHPGVVPFLGITNSPLQLNSSWMPGGNVMEYIKRHPGADRLALVRHLYSTVQITNPLSSYSMSLRLYITSIPATWFTEI